MPVVTLPDGSKRKYDNPVTVHQIDESIRARLAKSALAGRIGDKLVDTSYIIEDDVELSIITEKSDEALEVIRHSTAHLLAQAVKDLFPNVQVTIGPVIDDGFYYDFSAEHQFTPEDLTSIEKRMGELAKRNDPVTRSVMSRDQAVEYFQSIGEAYKAEIIRDIPASEELSLYTQGDFTDLCRGPHVQIGRASCRERV